MSDLKHVKSGHTPGYLFDCPACEARCHCTGETGNTLCAFDGPHMPAGMQYIAYFNIPHGRTDEMWGCRSLAAVKRAFASYGNATGYDRSSVVLTPDGNGGHIREYTGSAYASVYSADTAEAWQTAMEYDGVGVPFDYPSYVMRFGPRGGVVVERA